MPFQQFNNCLIFFTSYSTPNNITQNPSKICYNYESSKPNPSQWNHIQQPHLLVSQWQLKKNRRTSTISLVIEWKALSPHVSLQWQCWPVQSVWSMQTKVTYRYNEAIKNTTTTVKDIAYSVHDNVE